LAFKAGLNSFTAGKLEETIRKPPHYMDKDYPAGPGITDLSLNEATDVAQKRPVWRMMCTFGATHS